MWFDSRILRDSLHVPFKLIGIRYIKSIELAFLDLFDENKMLEKTSIHKMHTQNM